MARKPASGIKQPSQPTRRPEIFQPAFRIVALCGMGLLTLYFCYGLLVTDGAGLAGIAMRWFGYPSFLLPLTFGLWGWRLFWRGEQMELESEILSLRLMGLLAALGGGCGLAALHLGVISKIGGAGGFIGEALGPGFIRLLANLLDSPVLPGNLFLVLLFVTGFMLATGFTLLALLDGVGAVALTMGGVCKRVLAWGAGSSRTARDDAEREWALTEPEPELEAEIVEPSPPRRNPEKSPAKASSRANKAKTRTAKAALPKRRVARSRIEPSIDPEDEESGPAFDENDPEPLFQENLDEPLDEPDVVDSPEPTPVKPSAAPRKRVRTRAEPPAKPSSAPVPAPAPRIEKTYSRPVSAPSVMTEARNQSLPPLELIDRPQSERADNAPESLEKMARLVEILLQRFGVQAKVEGVESGPVITCFELDPAPGVKASQITNLSKDLARGLSVASVRVLEVIPGKSVVGLEVPNSRREIVFLGEIIKSTVYQKSKTPLTLALGLDSSGRPIVADLASMPHLLVAGTTGSGKSVAINAMLLSMLYKATAQELRLIMVDPKLLELPVYDDIPHLLTPVVTDMRQAANALSWCVGEMERRYRLMAALKVRNIGAFNRKIEDARAAGQPLSDPLWDMMHAEFPGGPPPDLEILPYIVVVIDELADMMMVVGKKVETLIARLAQKARAAGIHLILATQRPSVDVITGLIKANIPGRISFKVSSKVDSRTILDQMGAEQLLGYGDMLYLPPGTGFPARVHGAFVDDDEINRVVEFLKETGEPNYVDGVVRSEEDEESEAESETGRGGNRNDDELF